jgi:NADH-quinone oxidoreductase subunit L
MFIGPHWEDFWRGAIFNGAHNHVLEQVEEVPFWVDATPTVVGLLGIATAYLMYMAQPLLPMRLAEMFRPIYLLFLNKWYFDEIYNTIFVQPLIRLARALWQIGDVSVIDGVPNGLAALTVDGSRQTVRLQTGSLAVYAFVMLIGVVALIGIFMLFR